MSEKIFIPFRSREVDGQPLDRRRVANLETVMAWWHSHGYNPEVVTDGLSGDAQFNRHRAYNRAVSGNPEVNTFVFTEADMLIHPNQIDKAIAMADDKVGLVVPFTDYHYLSDKTTAYIRDLTFGEYALNDEDLTDWFALEPSRAESIFQMPTESVMKGGKSIGAVNVVSRLTLDMTGGFTEATSGNWYDDNIIEEGFAFLAGSKTRWVKGPAVHLYHLPGWTGDHLSEADKAATARNKRILNQMRSDIRRRDRLAVKTLMSTRDLTGVRR